MPRTRRIPAPDFTTASNAELAADARRDRDRHYDQATRYERDAGRYEEHAALIERNAAWNREHPEIAAIIVAEGGDTPEQMDEAAAALHRLAAKTRDRAPQYRELARAAAARARRYAARAADDEARQAARQAERDETCLLHDGCPVTCEYRGQLSEDEAANLADSIGGAPVGGCETWAANE
jgi:hypothetical protein